MELKRDVVPLIAYVKSCDDMTRWTSTNEQKIPPASFHYVSLEQP